MGCKAEGVGTSGFCYGYYIIFHGCASIIIACSLLWNELLVVADEQDFSGCMFENFRWFRIGGFCFHGWASVVKVLVGVIHTMYHSIVK